MVNKFYKKAVVINVIQSNSNIKMKEHEKLEKILGVESRTYKKDLESEANSGASSNGSICGFDPQTGRVAPTDSGIKMRNLYPEVGNPWRS